MAKNIVRLHRIAAAHRGAHQLDQNVVAVFRRTSFDRNVGGRALAHLFERFVYLLVAHLNLVNLHVQVLVVAQFEFRQHLEDRAKLQRLAFLEVHVVDFRPRNRNELFLIERLPEIFRHERLHHFALNVIGEAASHQRHRRFSGTKPGNPRHARDVARHFLGGFLDVVRWNFQLNLSFAGCFSHGKERGAQRLARPIRILSPVRSPRKWEDAGKIQQISPPMQYRELNSARQPTSGYGYRAWKSDTPWTGCSRL